MNIQDRIEEFVSLRLTRYCTLSTITDNLYISRHQIMLALKKSPFLFYIYRGVAEDEKHIVYYITPQTVPNYDEGNPEAVENVLIDKCQKKWMLHIKDNYNKCMTLLELIGTFTSKNNKLPNNEEILDLVAGWQWNIKNILCTKENVLRNCRYRIKQEFTKLGYLTKE